MAQDPQSSLTQMATVARRWLPKDLASGDDQTVVQEFYRRADALVGSAEAAETVRETFKDLGFKPAAPSKAWTGLKAGLDSFAMGAPSALYERTTGNDFYSPDELSENWGSKMTGNIAGSMFGLGKIKAGAGLATKLAQAIPGRVRPERAIEHIGGRAITHAAARKLGLDKALGPRAKGVAKMAEFPVMGGFQNIGFQGDTEDTLAATNATGEVDPGAWGRTAGAFGSGMLWDALPALRGLHDLKAVSPGVAAALKDIPGIGGDNVHGAVRLGATFGGPIAGSIADLGLMKAAEGKGYDDVTRVEAALALVMPSVFSAAGARGILNDPWTPKAPDLPPLPIDETAAATQAVTEAVSGTRNQRQAIDLEEYPSKELANITRMMQQVSPGVEQREAGQKMQGLSDDLLKLYGLGRGDLRADATWDGDAVKVVNLFPSPTDGKVQVVRQRPGQAPEAVGVTPSQLENLGPIPVWRLGKQVKARFVNDRLPPDWEPLSGGQQHQVMGTDNKWYGTIVGWAPDPAGDRHTMWMLDGTDGFIKPVRDARTELPEPAINNFVTLQNMIAESRYKKNAVEREVSAGSPTILKPNDSEAVRRRNIAKARYNFEYVAAVYEGRPPPEPPAELQALEAAVQVEQAAKTGRAPGGRPTPPPPDAPGDVPPELASLYGNIDILANAGVSPRAAPEMPAGGPATPPAGPTGPRVPRGTPPAAGAPQVPTGIPGRDKNYQNQYQTNPEFKLFVDGYLKENKKTSLSFQDLEALFNVWSRPPSGS